MLHDEAPEFDTERFANGDCEAPGADAEKSAQAGASGTEDDGARSNALEPAVSYPRGMSMAHRGQSATHTRRGASNAPRDGRRSQQI